MHDLEVTMHDSKPGNELIAYTVALEAAAATLALVRKVPTPFKSLADQVIRAASSVPANLNEGHGRFGRDRLNHWRIAYGSAKEVDAFLRLLIAAGSIEETPAKTALDLFDRVRALTWRLIHPKKP
jgi:four helix bundle protein